MLTYTDVYDLYEATGVDNKYRCDLCDKEIKSIGGSTSGLHRHLTGVHSYRRLMPIASPIKSPLKQTNLIGFAKKNINTMEEELAKLACDDGLSINQIKKSKFIKKSFNLIGFRLPDSGNTIMRMIYTYGDEIKSYYIDRINHFLKIGNKISISIDDWSSLKTRKYMNIHLYSNDFNLSLGLIRLLEHNPSFKYVDILKTKLLEYNIKICEDVISLTSDGCSTMLALGKLISPIHVVCMSHGIHLAVTKTFYRDKQPIISNEEIINNSNLIEFIDSDEEIHTCSDDYSDEEIGQQYENSEPIQEKELCAGFKETIDRIRAIVRHFKKSQPDNDKLQVNCKLLYGKELQCIIDVPTRWNSLLDMVARFNRIENAIDMTLLKIKKKFSWNKSNSMAAHEICNLLDPFKEAILQLNLLNSNLLETEGILHFLINGLNKYLIENKSVYGDILLKELKKIILDRRNYKLSSLIRFLKNPVMQEEDDVFKLASKEEMIQLAKSILSRIFKSSMENYTDQNDDIMVIEEDSSIKNQLKRSISMFTQTPRNITTIFNSLDDEFESYITSGKLTENLERIYRCLMIVKPTSTQNERNFSTSSLIINKLRNKLTDKNANVLCFLKSHFNSTKE